MASEIIPFIDKDQLANMREFVEYLKTHSALPDNENAGQVMMKLQAAKDMGLTPTQALTGIAFVNGKLAVFGAAAASLMVKHGYDLAWGECTDKTATLKVTKGDRSHSETFTIEDAKKAGLAGKAGPWTLYTRDMLRWKALARARNFFCPEVGGGLPIKEDYQETEKELAQAEPAKIAEAQENAKAAIDDAKKRRKAAKEAVAGLPAPAAQGVVEVPKGDPAGVMEALVEAAATAPTPEEIAAAQPEAKAFEDESPAAPQESPYDVDTPVGYLRMQWEHPGLPKRILTTRKLAGSLEQWCGRVVERIITSLADLNGTELEKCIDFVLDRNSSFDLAPEGQRAAPKSATLMASPATLAALTKAMGGETWFKKAMRRKFGHDNSYALTAQQADELKADLHPSSVQAVEKTLAQVAEQERAAGKSAGITQRGKLLLAWEDKTLADSVLAARKAPGALHDFCSRKLDRADAKADNLTETEVETMISHVLARNLESPKKS